VAPTLPARAYDPVTQTPARTVPLQIKVVLVGIDSNWIDTNYLIWNQLTPVEQYQSVQATAATTGILFKLSYDVVFATQSFRDKYVQFLRSIEVSRKIKNPWFTYRTWNEGKQDYEYTIHECTNVLYDAVKVEEWLYQNRDGFGGTPVNGWTLIVTYLPELPSFSFANEKDWGKKQKDPPSGTPHYYSVSAADFDVGYQYSEMEFMKGWSGKYRQTFVDLNAGPIPWTQSQGEGWGDSPLQWALEDFNIKLGSSFGRSWLSEVPEFMSSIVSG
jgi:hypothetical protein